MDNPPVISFEAADEVGGLLRDYDTATDRWTFPQTGDFWDAVRAAHGRGQRGLGARIAIVDTACDLRIPLLARATGGQAVMASAAGEPNEHGTAVALLVATVAPDAQLDIYEITRDGLPDVHRIAEALVQIAQSDASLVCMSLGMVQDCNLDATQAWIDRQAAHGGLPAILDAMVARPGLPKQQIAACQSEVCLCQLVDKLQHAGKRVLAAVGNTEDEAFCPASAAGAIAVGFQLDRREIIGFREAAWSAPPEGYAQSSFTDVALMQPPGVLGSSFATPLVVGALALGIDSSAMRQLMTSVQIGSLNNNDMAAWYRGNGRDPDIERKLAYVYSVAIGAHPHYPSLAPDTLLGSAVLGSGLFINAGLFFMGIGDFELARKLLSWARAVVPRNRHAAAGLGKTLYLMAQRADRRQSEALALAQAAIAQYTDAIELCPGFEPYLHEKALIEALIASGC